MDHSRKSLGEESRNSDGGVKGTLSLEEVKKKSTSSNRVPVTNQNMIPPSPVWRISKFIRLTYKACVRGYL